MTTSLSKQERDTTPLINLFKGAQGSLISNQSLVSQFIRKPAFKSRSRTKCFVVNAGSVSPVSQARVTILFLEIMILELNSADNELSVFDVQAYFNSTQSKIL